MGYCWCKLNRLEACVKYILRSRSKGASFFIKGLLMASVASCIDEMSLSFCVIRSHMPLLFNFSVTVSALHTKYL